MSPGTRKVLCGLGVDFAKTAPFPCEDLRDPVTGALCAGGVIYTNARDKGVILDRFLEHIVFRKHLLHRHRQGQGQGSYKNSNHNSNHNSNNHNQTQSQSNKNERDKSSRDRRSRLPPELIFVDDRRENVDCVARVRT